MPSKPDFSDYEPLTKNERRSRMRKLAAKAGWFMEECIPNTTLRLRSFPRGELLLEQLQARTLATAVSAIR
jgi:hypothetical protein